ncbi:MAG: cysteine hydrolase [Candidatus Atribacteria bacterium]|nr:cysteine hydrolase [Candidatus Atribacteria bacterium]
MKHCIKDRNRGNMQYNEALLVVDMQNEGLLNREVFHKQELIHHVNNLISFFRKNKKSIFFIRHTNKSFLEKNTDGWQICEELDLSKEDIIINKRNLNVFREPHFLSLLKEYQVTKVIITGLISNVCIKAACFGALEAGFPVTLISDGHSTFQKNAEKIVSDCNLYLKKQGVEVISTREFLRNH